MRTLCLLCGLLAGLALACGDDDGDVGRDAGGNMDAGPRMDGGGGGGTGGTAGNTNTGNTSGTGGGGAPPLVCGNTTCPAPPGQALVDGLASLGFPVPPLFQACCTEDDACGLSATSTDDAGISSTECVPRPESDPRCPDRSLFGVAQPGCCIESTGMCGVNAAQVGGACTDYSGGLQGALLGFGPVACMGLDDGGTEDGGS